MKMLNIQVEHLFVIMLSICTAVTSIIAMNASSAVKQSEQKVTQLTEDLDRSKRQENKLRHCIKMYDVERENCNEMLHAYRDQNELLVKQLSTKDAQIKTLNTSVNKLRMLSAELLDDAKSSRKK